jgi:catechol 2,3-dioxygenase-like lactoylglutathione lyase family enzyme
MTLSRYELNASIAVSDMARASEFYEDKLGLRATSSGADGSKVYESALHVYPSPGNAGMSAATLATWYVDDVEEVVEELAATGVKFEHYDGIVAARRASRRAPAAARSPGSTTLTGTPSRSRETRDGRTSRRRRRATLVV